MAWPEFGLDSVCRRVVLLGAAVGLSACGPGDGSPGPAAGGLRSPPGILVHEDLLYIVERNNRRVQVFTLPEFESVATFGEGILLWPYGISGFERDGALHLRVTDDFEVTGEGAARCENRVKRFVVTGDVNGMDAQFCRDGGSN